MSYQKNYPNGWQSGEAGGTPITPAALDNIENGIANALPKDGTDPMTADLPMGGHRVTGLGAPVADGDAVPLGYARKVGNPHNLLDNSDFRNPVNQRGKTSYTTDGYSIDRWYVTSYGALNGHTLSLESGYIRIQSNVDCSRLYQNLENYAQLFGKKCTIALKADGTIYSAIFKMGGGKTMLSSGIEFISVDELHVILDFTGTHNLEWVALYEGEYTAENLPDYQPKGYSAELMECRRYFYKTSAPFSTSVTNSDWLCGGIQFPITMRTTPSIANLRIVDVANSNVNLANETTIVNRTPDGVGAINHTGAFANMSHCLLEADFSADL